MLSTTRFLRDGTVIDWEFGMIVEEDGGVVLWPYPKGVRSEHGFRLVRTDPWVFEAPEHDFPVRIIYERLGPDRLRPRIEGSEGQEIVWNVERVACQSIP